MHLIDLEFSETLELNHRISGGWGFVKNVNLNQDIDVEFDDVIDPRLLDEDYLLLDEDNLSLSGNFTGYTIWEEYGPVSLYVGDQIVENAGTLVGGVS